MLKAVLFALAIPPMFVSGSAQAAITKGTLIACKEQGMLKSIAEMRRKKDATSTSFVTDKLSRGDCVELPGATKVSIDMRAPPLACVRTQGDLECYWTLGAFIDEFPPLPGQNSFSMKPKSGRGPH